MLMVSELPVVPRESKSQCSSIFEVLACAMLAAVPLPNESH